MPQNFNVLLQGICVQQELTDTYLATFVLTRFSK